MPLYPFVVDVPENVLFNLSGRLFLRIVAHLKIGQLSSQQRLILLIDCLHCAACDMRRTVFCTVGCSLPSIFHRFGQNGGETDQAYRYGSSTITRLWGSSISAPRLKASITLAVWMGGEGFCQNRPAPPVTICIASFGHFYRLRQPSRKISICSFFLRQAAIGTISAFRHHKTPMRIPSFASVSPIFDCISGWAAGHAIVPH